MNKLNQLKALLEAGLDMVNSHIDFCGECEHYNERDYWIAYSNGLRDALKTLERLDDSKTQKEVKDE